MTSSHQLFDAEFFNGYAVAISGIDISFICLFRALFSSVFGFFLGLGCPLFLSPICFIVLLLLKSVLVVPSWWSGYRTAIFICSYFLVYTNCAYAGKCRQAKTVHDSAETSGNKYDLESGKVKKPETQLSERLLMLAKPEKYLLLIGTIALVFANIATLVIPALFGQLINLIGQDKSVEEGEKDLMNIVVALALWVVVMSVFTFLRGWLYTLAGERLVARFRKQLFRKIAYHDISFYDQIQSGELVNRLASDTSVVQNAVTVNISMALRFTGPGMIGRVIRFLRSPKLTGVIFAVVPIVMAFAICYGHYLKKVSKLYQDFGERWRNSHGGSWKHAYSQKFWT